MPELTDRLALDGWRLIDRDGAWIGKVEELCGGERGDGLDERRLLEHCRGGAAAPVAVAAPALLHSPVTTGSRR